MTKAQGLVLLSLSFVLQTPPADRSVELTDRVTRMARVGSVTAPSFSPDGLGVRVISNVRGPRLAYVVPSAGGWPRMITDAADPVVGAVWSPAPGSDWIAVTVAPGGGLNTQIYLVRANGTGSRRLTDGGQDNNAFNAWSGDGTRIYFDSNRRDAASRDSFVVDINSGRIDLVAENPGIGSITSVSRDGRRALLARLRSRGNNNLYLLDLAGRKETLLTPHEGPAQYFGEIAPDGSAIYFGSNEGRDMLAFSRIRFDASGTAGRIELLRERADAELDGVRVNEQGTVAALNWNAGGRSELELFDLGSNKVLPAPKLPGEIVGTPLFSRDGQHMAITVSGAAQPPDVWVAATGQPFRQVTFAQRAGVDLSTFVRPELVKYRAHDGLELSGWLYRPAGVTGPAPYVLSFHGGPEGQERPGFRADYQALLSQGIGVFAPNVRGSSGFGKKFVNLDNGELRFNGIKDIKSSVDYLVTSRIADPKRIGITGGSYGGYMTMVGLTEYPELFAAGVNLFGMVNFFTFFKHTQPWMAAISTIEYGDPATQKDLLEKLSPLGKLSQIRAATMVQHGANDTNVPVVEAEQIVAHLKSRGIPVEYILFPDEGHGWRKVPNRIRSTVEMVRFFDKHLNHETKTLRPGSPGLARRVVVEESLAAAAATRPSSLHANAHRPR
jgi:dipeptidyl aminopeptidase/acylaminoacyl peptidase